MNPGRRLAIFLHDLSGGGAQRRALTLAGGLVVRGHDVVLVVLRGAGALRGEIPAGVRLTEIETPVGAALRRWLRLGRRQQLVAGIPALVRFLRRENPDLFLAAASHVNLPAAAAHAVARSPAALVLRASNHYSGSLAGRRSPFLKTRMMRVLYPRADAIVAVADAVAEDLVRVAGVPRERITTIYNPLYTTALLDKAAAAVEHRWLTPSAAPVILGVGRLSAQKDYPTLIRAFAVVRAHRPAHLLILGGSKKPERRERLMRLARQLGVSDDVDLPGFAANPLAYMARASVFVLSSSWEGLPGSLLEAMACGCPVVSTDCPGGSREILDGGRYGPLVPPGDAAALARAIEALLDAPPPRDTLRRRAAEFGVDRALDGYIDLFTRVLTCKGASPST